MRLIEWEVSVGTWVRPLVFQFLRSRLVGILRFWTARRPILPQVPNTFGTLLQARRAAPRRHRCQAYTVDKSRSKIILSIFFLVFYRL
jgi:hypothetical protein